ncbi:MAG: MFS transporter [Steroidobacteraceae bacterium]
MKERSVTSQDAGWPSAGRAWYMITVLLLAYIVSFIDRVIIALLVGPIRADLGISDTQMSVLYGLVFAVFYTGIGIPIAWAIDRYNRRNIVVTGIALWSLMTTICGIARNFVELALARIGVAIGEACLSPAAYSMAGDSFPERKLGRALSVFVVGLPMGVGLALIIGGMVIKAVSASPSYDLPLLGEIRAWQLTFFAVGIPGILLSLWALTISEPPRRSSPAADAGEEAAGSILAACLYMLRRWRLYASFILGFSVLGMVLNVIQIWGVQYFMRVIGLTAPQAGLRVGAAIAVFGTVGILAGGYLTDRWRAAGQRDAAVRTGLCAAIGVLPFAAICTTLGSDLGSTLALAPISFFSAFAFGAGATGIVVITPAHMRAQASAVYLLFVNLIGIGLAPVLTASITDYWYRSDLAVGKATAIVTVSAAAVAAILLGLARKPFRAALAWE